MKITFRREDGFPRELRPGTAITCSYSEVFTIEADSEYEAFQKAQEAGTLIGGRVYCSGIDNTRATWEAMFGKPTDPKHFFAGDDAISSPSSPDKAKTAP